MGEGYFCQGNQQKRLLWRRSYWREICKKTEKKMLGIWMLKKLFNKCIEINRIIKAIVWLVCAWARPVRPPSATTRPVRRAPARSVRNRPTGPPAAARSRLLGWPPLRRAQSELTALPTVSICFNLFESVWICSNPFQYVSIHFNMFEYVWIRFNPFQYVPIRFNLI